VPSPAVRRRDHHVGIVSTSHATSPPQHAVAGQAPPAEDETVARLVSAMLWSAELQTVKRYYDMTFWEAETAEEREAESLLSGPRLESVADHSWHLCDCVLLLHGHFGHLDLGRCLAMAVVHDKAEIRTGDTSPMGSSGTGRDGTAFDVARAQAKERDERTAVEAYLDRLPAEAAHAQRLVFDEYLERRTAEARFVYALDKLQVLTWLIRRKQGLMSDEHLRFSLRYLREKALAYAPLEPFVDEFERRLLGAVALARGPVDVSS
jgi:5'-deoxynucleotidase YfbR-like HD superfamily hydrolase